jgi:alpha,alpha-trehalase
VGIESLRAAGHRVEHLELADREMIASLVGYRITASVQPAFDRLWGGDRQMYARRLGPERALATNPLGAMHAVGVAMAFGSDSPVTPLDPWGTIRAAIWHHQPRSRLSARAAFAAHTRGGWRAVGQEHHGPRSCGSLASNTGNVRSRPVFSGLLDHRRGGVFRLTCRQLRETRQYYLEDTGVLVTELRTGTGVLEITDAFTFADGGDLPAGRMPAGNGELLRALRVVSGEVEVELAVEPRGYAEGELTARSTDGQWQLRGPAWPGVTVWLGATGPLSGLRSTWRLRVGQRAYAWLSWQGSGPGAGRPEPAQRIEQTVRAWRSWTSHLRYDGPAAGMVRRAAVTLKLLDHAENGAIVAAPTSSLPEAIGGPRNWDYRFTWIRDAAFSVYALRRIGLTAEAETFLDWVLEMVDRHGEPRVLYDLDGHIPVAEQTDPVLEGYRRSPPVRWGNAAVDQAQHDVYGEILDCAYQRVAGGGKLDPPLWSWLRRLADTAGTRWNQPDRGIWEVRSQSRRFTYSVALCQVALDRAARLAQRLDLPGEVQRWQETARLAREAVIEQSWDPRIGAFTERLPDPGEVGDEELARRGLDAGVLALPLRRVVPSSRSGGQPARSSPASTSSPILPAPITATVCTPGAISAPPGRSAAQPKKTSASW